uniref:Eukaryotic translation initiation factor 3 subunit p66 n=1 Tax=Parastrongyloides trichosuri TaxID=131310 RepID=A0A0N4ZRC7_PARTI
MSLPKLELLNISENLEGWGPNIEQKHDPMEQFRDLPFQSFNRCERIGRISDWIGVEKFFQRNRAYGNKDNSASQFDYIHDADENFQLVDSSKPQKPIQQRYRNRNTIQFKKIMSKDIDDKQNGQSSGKHKRSVAKEHMKQFKIWQKRGGNVRTNNARPQNRKFGERGIQKVRQPSVQVQPDWQHIVDLDFPTLQRKKAPHQLYGLGEDIKGHSYGAVHYYDKSIDRLTPKNSIELKRFGGAFISVPTLHDCVIERLNAEKCGNIFATDIILATLMSATRSVYSWDIIIHKVGNVVVFDKRENVDSLGNPVDQYTVNETHPDPPAFEGIGENTANELATEALHVNLNFRRQVLKRNAESYKFENENIPIDDDYDASLFECAFKYRKWNLGTSKQGVPLNLVCRTEINGASTGNSGETQLLTIKAFNEWDSTVRGHLDWRKSLETQRGSVLATEMRNNSCKLAKWTLQAILAGTDNLKIGYVSRASPKNSTSHCILGVQNFRPVELAQNISLDLDNCWGVLKSVVEMVLSQPDGKYLLMKDPISPVLKFYSLPKTAFESSEDESSEEED